MSHPIDRPLRWRRLLGALLITTGTAGCGSDHTPTEPPTPGVSLRDAAYTAAMLPTLGGADAYANAINAQGLVVGSAKDAAGTTWPVVWRGGAVTRLASGDAASGSATAVNARGDVAGTLSGVAARPDGAVRLWLADGRTRTPGFVVSLTSAYGPARVICCNTIRALNAKLQAVAITSVPRVVADTTQYAGWTMYAAADFSVDTAKLLISDVAGGRIGALNEAGHAVGAVSAFEAQNPWYLGVSAPTSFEPLPDGAPRLATGQGHSFSDAELLDDADRIYGAVNGAYYAAPAGGAGIWLYPYLGNAPLGGVSSGGLLAAGPTTEACTRVAARCLPAGTVFVWRASDHAVFAVALPAGWRMQSLSGINDAGQIVGQGTDGVRTGAVVLTPSSALPR